MKKAPKNKTYQFKDLCSIGQILSTAGMNVFLQHVQSCAICSKTVKK